MSAALSATWNSDVEDELCRALVGIGDGDTEVLDASVSLVPDGDDGGWLHVVLVLPAPKNRREGWDIAKTQLIKRQARRISDDLLANNPAAPPGLTLVSVTTRGAPQQEIAAEETPQEGEGSSHPAPGI